MYCLKGIKAFIPSGEEDPVIQSMGLKLEYKTRRFVTDDTQELHFRIEIQNKVYKREVAALDKEIGRLEKILSDPLESSTSSGSANWRKVTVLLSFGLGIIERLHKITKLTCFSLPMRCSDQFSNQSEKITDMKVMQAYMYACIGHRRTQWNTLWQQWTSTG